jgi:type II secretory pathway component PulC
MELERSAADARLEKEMPVILAETELVPCVEEGEVQGLEIARLPGGTILSDAGLLPGDVLLSINELPMDGFSALIGLYPRLRSEDEIRVVVERGGQILKLAYNFH